MMMSGVQKDSREDQLLLSIKSALESKNYTDNMPGGGTQSLRELLVNSSVHMEATSDTSVTALSASGVSDPQEYVSLFEDLVKFTEDTTAYKQELSQVLFPVFAHIYLHFVSTDLTVMAQNFYNKFYPTMSVVHNSEMKELSNVVMSDHLKEPGLGSKFRSKKYSIRMSDPAFNLLMQFLQMCSSPVLLNVIQQYVAVEVFGSKPPSNGDHKTDKKVTVGPTFYKPKIPPILHSNTKQPTKHIPKFPYGSSAIFVPPSPSSSSSSSSSSSNTFSSNTFSSNTITNSSTTTPPHGHPIATTTTTIMGVSASTGGGGAAISTTTSNSSGEVLVPVTLATATSASPTSAATTAPSGAAAAASSGGTSSGLGSFAGKKPISRVSNTPTPTPTATPTATAQGPSAQSAHLSEFREKLSLASSLLNPSPPSLALYTCETQDDLQGVHSASYSSTARLFCCGMADSSLHLWSLSPSAMEVPQATFDLIQGAGPEGQGCYNETGSTSAVRDTGHACLMGHHGPVYGTCFSNSGGHLLSASEDCSVRLWDVKKASNLVCYRGHAYPVWNVAFSPVDVYFASASYDKTARLWCTDSVYPLRIFAGHTAGVDVVQFHPNGQYIATGSSDHTCRLWDLQSGHCVRLMSGSKGPINCLSFSPSGKVFATGGEDCSVRLWDLGSGEMVKEFQGHNGPIVSLAYSPDGTMLASSCHGNQIKIWNVKSPSGSPKSMELSSHSTGRTTALCLSFTHRNCLLAIGKSERTESLAYCS